MITQPLGPGEALALRAADRFRQRFLPFQLDYEKEAFRAAGGTDAGQAVMAELRLRQSVSSRAAARALAEELGIDLEVMPTDEARAAVIEKVQREHSTLVAQVVEACRAYPVTAADEELAQRIAAQAPARMRADALASRERYLAELTTSLSGNPYAVAAVRASTSGTGEDPLESVTRDSWERCLAALAAPELGVPGKDSGLLCEHPAVQRGLQLVGAVSTATSDEIESHRPILRLTPSMEQAARRIAAEAERNLRLLFTTAFQESDPTRSPADTAAALETAMAKKNPSVWHASLSQVAAKEIGDPGNHPATLRAQELIPGLPTHYDRLISERAMSPIQAAHEYAEIMELHAALAVVEVPGLLGEIHPLPPNPPMAMKFAYLPVTHLGGHPALRSGQKRLWLMLSGAPEFLVCSDAAAKHEVARIECSKIHSLTVQGPESLQSRVTVPRLAAGGLLAFGFKKEHKRAYLVFGTHTGGDVIFEVPGKSRWELEAEVSPLLKWLEGKRVPAQ